MKARTAKGLAPFVLLIVIAIGIMVTSWYYSSFSTDDSWIEAANQLLEEAKPYPEWNDDYLMVDYVWLFQNDSEQFVGTWQTSNFTESLGDLLLKTLSEANTQTRPSIAESDLNRMLESNKVLRLNTRFSYEFPALNNHVWTLYFVLDNGSTPGLKGTVFVDRDVWGSESGSGNWTGWKISPFPMVWAITISVTVAVVGLGLLVYCKRGRGRT